jgi:phosphoglycolate phosphatase-like HAD superfamily hydrolase
VSENVSLDLTGRIDTLRREEKILMRIFDHAPKLFPGVRAVLNKLQMAGIKIGIVTHAPLDWTILKLEKHGLYPQSPGLQLGWLDFGFDS